jgi:hypothetical protein
MEESLRKPVRKEMDQAVRAQLTKWPQRPPGVVASRKQPGTWLRGRPGDSDTCAYPFLKLPGSNRLRTLPDGMWLHFSPSALDPYVDIICIEACSSVQNLLDKRSRFAPSTSSLLACCPVPWLLAPAEPDDEVPVPRWRMIRMLHKEPTAPLVLPVRDARVLFGLKSRHYECFMQGQVAQAHEFFCPMEALTAEGGHEDPEMRALIARASAAANFMRMR